MPYPPRNKNNGPSQGKRFAGKGPRRSGDGEGKERLYDRRPGPGFRRDDEDAGQGRPHRKGPGRPHGAKPGFGKRDGERNEPRREGGWSDRKPAPRHRRDDEEMGQDRPYRSGQGRPHAAKQGFGKRDTERKEPRREGSWSDRKPGPSHRRDDEPKAYSPKRHDFKDAPRPRHHAKPAPTNSQGTFPKVEGRESVPLWGIHAARAAWINPARKIYRIWATEAALESLNAAIESARADGLARPNPKIVERSELDAMLPADSVHQGIILDVAPLEPVGLETIIADDGEADLIVVLDQVTDPHNVGAVLRSAAAFGASAVLVMERNAPAETGVMAKTACGALDLIPLVPVVNLARSLRLLQDHGYGCIGLAEEGEATLAEVALPERVVLVMGSEGEGLRRLTRETCNTLARLPTKPLLGSLNVSNAAAVALYEMTRRRG